MTQPVDMTSEIGQLLIQQKARLQAMLTTLEQELEAVKTRNGEALAQVAKLKEAQLTSISEADAQFNTEQYIALIKATPNLSELKDEIKALLAECQQKNEVIYLAATQNQVAIDQVKRLLIGGSKNTTYDAYGKKQSGASFYKGVKA